MKEQVFKTTTGTITLKQDTLIFNRLIGEDDSRYRYHSFILLTLVIVLRWWWSESDRKAESDFDTFQSVVWTAIFLYWMYPHLKYAFNWLFRFTWRNRIPMSRIQSAEKIETENELECGVRLHLQSGRVKEVMFRREEGYAEKLLQLFEPQGITIHPGLV